MQRRCFVLLSITSIMIGILFAGTASLGTTNRMTETVSIVELLCKVVEVCPSILSEYLLMPSSAPCFISIRVRFLVNLEDIYDIVAAGVGYIYMVGINR